MVRLSLGLPLAGLLTSTFATVTLPMRDLPPLSGQTCPESCHEAGYMPSNWTVVAEFDQLKACPRPILMDFSLDIPVSEKQIIRTCDTWGTYYYYTPAPSFGIPSENEQDHVIPHLALSAAGNNSQGMRARYQAVTAVKKIQSHLQRSAEWNRTILFGAFGGATVGVYIGENMQNPSVADSLLKPFMEKIMSVGIESSKAALLQVCGNNRTGDNTFGIIAASNKGLSTAQAAVKQWANATCVDTSSYTESSTLNGTVIRIHKPVPVLVPSNTTTTNLTTRAIHMPILNARGDCRAIGVISGDSCGALATRCGISPSDFTKYNNNPKLCSSLTPGQHVCCSSGTLPDFRPKPNSDGSCAVYETKSGDNCATIAAANSLKKEDLETLNKRTWGWAGCDSLWVGVKMCLSKGDPPMPAPIANAICGPQKPGTPIPPKGANISELNPCPLNTCCNIWGQCGTTEDFCIDTRGDGAPGTAKKGTYGCISNCGMDIVKGDPPAQFIKLGYFEAFNLGRECLNMDVRQIDSSYTHVHFAFAVLTDDFEVYLEDEYQKYQFEQFKKIRSFKRILSFGGWAFSAELPHYQVFRNGVKTANREKLASNIAKFINDNGLDGVDIDWEYPGAPDIPGIPPPDDAYEGIAYAAFLSILKSKLNSGKSLSIAAPASYWYLKQFPIKGISRIVDYIVYMTYDLHGQWDSGTLFNAEIREIATGSISPRSLSHGNDSSVEIRDISASANTWYDKDSDSNIMTYGDNWVAYMVESVRARRANIYKGYNMGGTTNWAVDLDKFQDPPSLIEGSDVKLSWQQIKQNIKKTGDAAACDKESRTGTWVTLDNCSPDAKCDPHHSSSDKKEDWTGACSYLVWNSFAQVHVLIKNYQYSLKEAAIQVQNKKNEFVDTFAPEGHRPDVPLWLNTLLTVLLIPSTTLGTAFWKGALRNLAFFQTRPLRLDLLKDTSQALVSAGYTISKSFIEKETVKEVTFNTLYDSLIGKWTEQIDTLVKELFDGSDEHIKQLSKIIMDGKMIEGKHDAVPDPDADHTASFLEQKLAERAFYAAAIPNVWKMRQPYASYPVILDFGPDCNRDIGSDQYFKSGQDYNQGWICLDGHNYILASTFERDNDGPNCSPEYYDWCNNIDQRFLFSLPGLDKIRKPDPKFGKVTVEDLVAGSVNTWKRAGKLNIIDGSPGGVNPVNKDDFVDLWDNDIRAPGMIRIPVCSVEEASFLAQDGTGHGLPDGDRPSFPCLRDPNKSMSEGDLDYIFKAVGMSEANPYPMAP
ncbi:chitinase [Microsporum canis CBS 113480]|uniref:chitinase n=1 Tax=Arthroderma otae (strain ATCC MYA-4605 / CBS 113480) TaxID=554155 RepID=C5FU03_ARTOC|nr:chitinase [Microsporum canis CBS 113480]EEQ33387.1 chitinase [Microsporum canis CBS 113480]